MKRILSLLMAFFILSGLQAQDTITLGNGTESTNRSVLPGYFGFHHSANLFTADELPAGGGVITSLSIETAGVTTATGRDLKIYMKEVADTALATSLTFASLLEDAFLVYDVNNINVVPDTWNEFVLESPFVYTGSGNLLIVYVGTGCSTYGGCEAACKYNPGILNKGWFKGSDGSPIDYNSVPNLGNAYRANTRFIYEELSEDFCFPVTDLAITEVLSNSVELEWDYDTPSSFVYELRQSSENWNDENVIRGTTTSTSLTINDLLPATPYVFRVMSDCGSDSSTYMQLSFNTACGEYISDLPYTESFNTGNMNCWTSLIQQVSYGDVVGPVLENISGDYICTFESGEAMLALNSLFEEPINNLRVIYRGQTQGFYNPDTIVVGLVTDLTNPTTFIPAGTMILDDSDVWYEKIVDFANVPVVDEIDYHLAFRVVGDSYTTIYLDDIEVGLIPSCPSPDKNSVVVTSGSTSATVTWTDENYEHEAWVVYYREAESGDTWSTTAVSEQTAVIDELEPETTYELFVVTDCGDGDDTDRTHMVEFTTTTLPVELPYYQDFENIEGNTGIRITNLSGDNTWAIGSATAFIEEGETGSSLYVTNNGGVSNQYSSSNTNTLASIIVDFAEVGDYILEFDYKGKGEGSYNIYDYCQVYFVDVSLPISQYANGTAITNKLVNINNWTHYSYVFPQELIGTTQNIVFAWRDDDSGSYGPPAAIDNISIRKTACASPEDIIVTGITESSAEIAWAGTADSYNVTYYKTSNPSEAITENTGDISIELTDLESSTPYTFIINAVCGDEISSPTTPMSFTTNCGAISDDVWFEDFEEATSASAAEQVFMCYDAVVTTTQNNGVFPRIYHEGYVPAAHSGSRTLEFKGNGLLALPIFSRPVNTLRFEFYANTTASDSATAGVMEVGIITDVTDPYTFVPLQQVTPVGFQRSGSFLVGPFDFNTMTETEGRIALRFTPASSNQGESWNLDDFKVMPIPACPSPVANSVVISDITDTQATVSWTDPDETHTAWTVYYKSSSDESYSTLAATEQSITLTDLTPTTSYSVYVMTNCGTDDNVARTDIVSFSTIATPISEFPYYQTFEDLENNPASFEFRNEYTNKWHIGTATGVVSEEGSDEITTSLYISNDNGVTNAYTIQSAASYASAIMPVSFGDANEYILSFDYKVIGESIGTSKCDFLKVFMCNSDVNIPSNGEPSSTGTVTLMDKTTDVSTWTNVSFNLTGVANTTKQIVFYWRNDTGSGANPPAAIDNISIVGLDCVSPTSLQTTAALAEEATLAWQENGTATEWTVYYKTAEETEYTAVVVNENPATLTGLIPATQYTAYVVANCGAEYSGTSNTITFVTECVTINSFPYFEGFNTTMPQCWGTQILTGYDNWGVTSNYNGTSAYEGEQMMKISWTNGQARLNTPIFDLTSLSNPTIKFAHLQLPYNSSCEEIKVQYKAEPTAEWTDIVTLNTPHSTWELDSIVLPNPSDTYQISFLLIGHYANGAAIDAFELYDCEDCEAPAEPEPCVEPTALTVSNITSSTATVTWEGTADSYEIRLNVGVAESVSTNSYQYTGLMAETPYVVEVRSVCGTETSEWVETFFYTLAEDEEVVAPTVATLAASEITHESAVLNGTITAGSEEITVQGFMYKATAAADWTTVNATGETISATLTALTAETEYIFKAFATTASGIVEGEAMTFTTTAAPVVIVAPEVVTLAASEITNASATLNGTVTAGSEEITAQGFMYKATAAADWTIVAATGENMTATVEGLEAEMAYEYKAFATTASGTVEGEVMLFTTLAGLNDAETINAMIYPNPADDKAIISVSVAGAKIVVSDMQGRILLSDDMNESTYELNTSNYAAGVYYIRIISGNTVNTQKLIVK
ncbi:MAG: fibronectin type III domain-containing protein [Bacteroidales bacterium]|nr:fibronectin type III domain-containing protein [Bacteroidales bacterium]